MTLPKTAGSWTVLVYIAANNELTPNGDNSLKAIKRSGSSNDVRTVIQIDRADHSGATRYVGADGSFKEIGNIGSIDTGDPRPLIEFLKWGLAECPAKHCLLVLWGHGAGLDGRTPGFTPGGDSSQCLGPHSSAVNSPEQTDSLQEILFDEGIEEILHDYQTKHYLSNSCLRFALEKARQEGVQIIDLLGLDACLMGMAEIVCDFRGSARFAITSEDTEPRASWPYENIIQSLIQNHEIDAQGLGKIVVDTYLKSFPSGVRQQGLTLSVCDLQKSNELIQAVRTLSSTLIDFLKRDGKAAIDRARAVAPKFDHDYIDLQEFCGALASERDARAQPEVVDSCNAVITILKRKFVVYSGSVGRPGHSDGVSIFLPTRRVLARKKSNPGKVVGKEPTRPGPVLPRALTPVALIRSTYSTLSFVRKTRWDQFLLDYLGQARSNSMQGGKMNSKTKAGSRGRKRPNSPRKKPVSPTKKSRRPVKKPTSPRKKPHLPNNDLQARELNFMAREQNLMAREQNLMAREQSLLAREESEK